MVDLLRKVLIYAKRPTENGFLNFGHKRSYRVVSTAATGHSAETVTETIPKDKQGIQFIIFMSVSEVEMIEIDNMNLVRVL